MSDIDNDDEFNEQLQINELEKKSDKTSEKNIYEDNDLLSKDRPSEASKNSELFFQQNNRFTTIENNFENSEEESYNISKRPSNISKTGTNHINCDNIKDDNNNNYKNSRHSKKEKKTKNSEIKRLNLKLILLGDTSVGKTSILTRYVDNKFDDKYKCTVEVERKTKVIDVDLNNTVNMNIWDTVGQEKFRTLTRQYYHDCHGAVIVFDLTKRETFEYLPKWIKELKDNGPDKIAILILGNKSDLTDERVVSPEEITKFIEDNYLFFEVSAKNGNNITLAFDKIREKILEGIYKNENTKDDIDVRIDMNPRDSEELDYLGRSVNEKRTKCC